MASEDIMAINELTAPPGTANVARNPLNNVIPDKVPLPGLPRYELSVYQIRVGDTDPPSSDPATITWNILCYCYKEVGSGVRFVMLHSGTTQTAVADVELKHEIKVLGSTGGYFAKHLPTNGVSDGDITHKYTINYAEMMNLQNTDSNEFPFNAKYQDEYSRRGFIQTGDNQSSSVRFNLRKDPGYGRAPRAFTQPIHGLTEFICPEKTDGKYEIQFEFKVDAGAGAKTKNHTISFKVEKVEEEK